MSKLFKNALKNNEKNLKMLLLSSFKLKKRIKFNNIFF